MAIRGAEHAMKNIIITGGCGLVGASLVKYLLAETDWKVRVIDKMTYAALDGKRLEQIGAFKDPKFTLIKQDVNQIVPDGFDAHWIVHLAAETHVERSIQWPINFLMSNVFGTYSMLEYARKQKNLHKFLYFSTDEVFGNVSGEPCNEQSAYNSGNPYSATKAAGEELTLAWGNTFSVPIIISHCSNILGCWQHEEKFLPKLIRLISQGQKVNIHADKEGRVGSRMYVHAEDVAKAIVLLLLKGEIGLKYNIPGVEVSNLDMAYKVADILDKTLEYEKVYPQADRPGWDFAYRISGEKIKELGWTPSPDFEGMLRQIVQSYAT